MNPGWRGFAKPLMALLAVALAALPGAADARLIIVGNEDKLGWDDAGKLVLREPGKDSVSIVDIGTDPENPTIVASLPLMNTIIGPPTNLAITPDERLALVANSMNWVQEGGAWKAVPDTRLYVIDLTTSPPSHIATVEVDKQPSGLSINARGDLALVANRTGNSILTWRFKSFKRTLTRSLTLGGSWIIPTRPWKGPSVISTSCPTLK